MELVVNNEKQLKRFYILVRLYRTRIFKWTKFRIKGKYNLKEFETSLNIKNRTKRLEYVYEEVLNQIDNYYDNKDVCHFCNGMCMRKHKNGCCRYCTYVTNKGCPSRNIACKMFNCTNVKNEIKPIEYKDLLLLKTLPIRTQEIIKHDLFTLKEDVIKDAKYNWLLYALIRMTIRIIKNLSKRLKNNK